MLKISRKLKAVFVITFLFLIVIGSFSFLFQVPPAKAKGQFGKTVAPETASSLQPVIYEQRPNSHYFNLSSFSLEFYGSPQNYNIIYDDKGNLIVENERFALECFNNTWRQIGLPVNIQINKISDYYYQVTRSYKDEDGTEWSVLYDVKSQIPVKVTVTVKSAETATYRLIWVFNGVKQQVLKSESNRVQYQNFYVDWNDVTTSYGDITENSVKDVTKGKKQDLTFNIGIVEKGKTFVLDPSFGYTTEGTYYDYATDMIVGSVFNMTENGDATSISIYLSCDQPFTSDYFYIKAAIYRYSDLALMSVATEEYLEIDGYPTFAWQELEFLSSVTLLQYVKYVLVVWASQGTATSGNLIIAWDAGDTGQGHYQSLTYTTSFPNPLVPSLNNREYSIYATYTASGGGDGTAPTYSATYYNSSVAGNTTLFSSYWNDNVALSHHIFSTNNTGAWANETATAFSSTPGWANTTKTLNSTVGNIVHYRWWANDTSNNWASTSILSLTVTAEYEEESTYTYTLIGPFLESGQVYNGIVNATINFLYQPAEKYVLNGSDTVEDTVIVSSSNPAVNVVWNITADHTQQRSHYFSEESTSETVYLYVPDTDNPFEVTQTYYISIADLAGLTNGYVEILLNVDGTMQVIERQELDTINAMGFLLIMYRQYTIRVTSDQGTWTFPLPADAVTSKNYAITRDMLSQTYDAYNCTVTATRTYPQNVTFYFNDPTENTTSVTSTFYYYSSGVLTEYYTQTDLSSTQSYTLAVWPEANYYIQVNALYSGVTLNWTLSAPVPDTIVTFDLTNGLNLFGSWPIPVRSLLGLFIVLVFFGIGSYRDSEFFAGVATLVALFLWAIGLLIIPLAAISMSLVVVVWMYLHKGKQEIRET